MIAASPGGSKENAPAIPESDREGVVAAASAARNYGTGARSEDRAGEELRPFEFRVVCAVMPAL